MEKNEGGLLEVHHLVKVHLSYYPHHEQLKKEIYDSLLHYEDKQNHGTNVKATMTEWNLITPEIQKLKDHIINALKELPNTLNWGPPGNFKFKFLWANIYRHGEYTKVHNHNPEDLAMVYFLTAHDGDAPLILEDSKTRIYPEEGLITLFPAYLNHGVPKHISNNIRMTLSGNVNRIIN